MGTYKRKIPKNLLESEYIYLMKMGLFKTKIGITNVSAEMRRDNIEKESGRKLRILIALKVPYAFAFEQFLHGIFSPFNVKFQKRFSGHTEFFHVPSWIVAPIIFLYWLFWKSLVFVFLTFAVLIAYYWAR